MVCLAEVAEEVGTDDLSISVDWAPNADYILVGSQSRLRLLNVGVDGSPQPVAEFDGHTDRVYVEWSPDGAFAITGSDDGHLRLLRVDVDEPAITELASFFGDNGSVYSASWSPDGTHILTGTEDGRIELLSADTAAGSLKIRAVDDGHEGKVFSVAWSPDGAYALSASGDHSLRLFAVDTVAGTLVPLDRLRADEEFVPVAWSPDGSRAVAGQWGSVNAVSLVAVSSGSLHEVQTIDLHDSGSRALAWFGNSVITGSHDNFVHLLQYDAVSDRLSEVAVLEDEGVGNHELSWAPDGSRVARVSSKSDRLSIIGVGEANDNGCDPG